MTDSRSARTATQVATDQNPDSRSARIATQVAVDRNPDVRSARTAIQVAIVHVEPILGGGWGFVGIGG